MADARAALIKSATAAVKKAFKGSILDVASRSLEFPSVFASTGSLSLDRLCAGGNPGGVAIGRRYGLIAHVAGEWSTGKSVILDQIFRSVLVDHKGLAYCTETEGTRTPHFMDAIGLPKDLLVIDRPDTFEKAFDHFEEWHEVVRKADPTIPVVWGFDSLDSTEAAKSADKGMSESGGWHFGGGRAEALGAGLRRVAKLCSRYPTTLVMLNQTRDNVGVMFGPKKRTPGGNPPHFYASLELMLSGAPRPGKGFVRASTPMPKLSATIVKQLGLYNMDDTAVLGRYVRAKVTKTKMATTLDTTADFYIDFRKGLHRWEGLLERMVTEGVVQTNGEYSEFTMAAVDKDVDSEERVKFGSKKEWLNYVAQNPGVLALDRAEAMKK